MGHVWHEIPLADYEDHMALPSVGQAQFLSSELGRLVAKFGPASIALLGAAGGNGLERPELRAIGRVVALDINSKFLAACTDRHAKRFECFVPLVHDLNRGSPNFEPVDFVFAGLILEYLCWEDIVRMLPNLLTPGGVFACVIQLRSRGAPEISPSPYLRLKKLRDSFNFVNPSALKGRLSRIGFVRRETRTVKLHLGKSFHVGVYQLNS